MKTYQKAILAVILSLVAACSGSAPDGQKDAVDPKSTVTSEPVHNYVLKEGQEYGYKGGISEEDQKTGKVAANINMFRFLGEKNGTYTVQMVDGNGEEILTASCAKPCQYMKLSSGDRVEYNTSSLGGSVMQDALAGQLEVYVAPKRMR